MCETSARARGEKEPPCSGLDTGLWLSVFPIILRLTVPVCLNSNLSFPFSDIDVFICCHVTVMAADVGQGALFAFTGVFFGGVDNFNTSDD